MKKKLFALLLGASLSLQSLCFTAVSADAVSDSSAEPVRTVHIDLTDYNFVYDAPFELELQEGEQIQLDFGLDPDIYCEDNYSFYSINKNAMVLYDGRLVGCYSGEDMLSVYVRDKDAYGSRQVELKLNITPNEDIPPENRKELDRLKKFEYNDYRRRKLQLLGVIDENAPRLTMEKTQEIIDSAENSAEILIELNKSNVCPDVVPIGSSVDSYTYWFDDKGNENVCFVEWEFVAYTKVLDDGTVAGSQILYPQKTVFYENGVDTDYDYIDFNSVSQAVKGDLNNDGSFTIADVVLLQNWLVGEKDTVLSDWKNADLCQDGILDVFDLCLMKKELVDSFK